MNRLLRLPAAVLAGAVTVVALAGTADAGSLKRVYSDRASAHTFRVYPGSSSCSGTPVFKMYPGDAADTTLGTIRIDYPFQYKYNGGAWSPTYSARCWKLPNPDADNIVIKTFN